MTIGGSLLLIGVGAILKFAVTWRVEGVDLHVAGVVLMVVGVVALLIVLLFLIQGRPGPPRVGQ